MRLQTAKHHVVRVFRVVMALVTLGLIGILTWNFAIRPRLKIPEGLIPKDLSGLTARTEGLTFQHTSGSRTFYTLKARTHESPNNAPHVFKGVEVLIYGAETDPDRLIQSDECTYDPQSGDIDFRNNVVAQLDEQTTGRTAALNYRNRERVVLSRSRVTVERPGEMSAAADSMEFGIETGVLKLAGNVHATMASGAELDGASAVFHRDENWAIVSGGAFVKTASGWARGDEARADLEPGVFRPTSITLRGNVTAESHSVDGAEVWRLERADRLDLAMSGSGAVERAAAFGQALFEKRAASGVRSLTAGSIVSWVDARGEVERIEASESARLEDRNGERLTRLTGEKIHIQPSGAILTEGASLLDSGDTTVVGRTFRIEQGDIATFTTVFPATIDTKRPGAPARHMRAEQSTTGRMDGKTNRLLGVVAIGNVQFTEGDRRGNADKITATEGGDVVILEGKATIIEPKTRVDAERIEISDRGQAFSASGAVKTVSESESGPVTVTARKARGRSGGASDRIFYSGDVKTIAKSASGPLRITASEAEGDSTTMTYTGNVDTLAQSESGLVRILANRGVGNADQMTYTGAAQLWRGDNVYIQSEQVVIWPKEKRFKAGGKVNSRMDTLRGTSASLEYDDARQEARYIGGVHLVRKDAPDDVTIDAAVVVARIADGKLSEATAEGAVTITRGASKGSGDRAVYNAAGDQAVLTGNPAHISDPVKGNSEGATLKMDLSRKNVAISGRGEAAPNGRVRTQTHIGQ
ncbi:MAG TPA: LPS export ABC transporter periplasmic protein LptC [Terriglobia bacterium]|nr:LPS export ABC transporter periplasmic protein LptC [Terriglobia bacterium]